MKTKKVLLVALIAVVAVSLTGCIKLKSSDSSVGAGLGIFASPDRGDSWIQKVSLMTPGAVEASIGGAQVLNLTMDPTDPDAIYAGTQANSLYYSYNGGDGWQRAFRLAKIAAGRVLAVAIDHSDRCSVYVAVENKIYKSSDCNRSWELKFNTPVASELIVSLVVDHKDTRVVYAGASDGTIYKSVNNGQSWTNMIDLKKRIKKIIMDESDHNTLYLMTTGDGLYRSKNGGSNWVNLNDNMKDFEGNVNNGYGLKMVKGTPNTLYYLNKFGLLRSYDGGNSWQQIKLLTGTNEVTFTAFDVSSRNAKYLMLADSKTVYRSLNGGSNWETRPLPTSNVITDMKFHLTGDLLIYTSYKKVQK